MPTRNSLLIDTNILIAAAYPKDVRHLDAVLFFDVYADKDMVVPAPVLTELYHVLNEREGYLTAFGAVANSVVAFEIVNPERVD